MGVLRCVPGPCSEKGTSHVEPCLSLSTGLLQKVQMAYKGILFDLEDSQAVEQVMQGRLCSLCPWKFSRPSCMKARIMWSDTNS